MTKDELARRTIALIETRIGDVHLYNTIARGSWRELITGLREIVAWIDTLIEALLAH